MLAGYSTPALAPFGDATPMTQTGTTVANTVVVAAVKDASGNGLWVVTATGQVLTYGDAQSYGDLSSLALNAPIVGIAATHDGLGYWLVASDGGVFSFGDATFYGSMGAVKLNAPVVGMAVSTDGLGYWMVAADGGIFTFGDATFYGSMGGVSLNASVSGMALTHDGLGYWLVASDGGVFSFGDATFYGSFGGVLLSTPIGGIITSSDGLGYYLLSPESFPYAYGDPSGGQLEDQYSATIANNVLSQIGPASDPGTFCNPYGPCEPWCAYFASWAWNTSGVPTPSTGFTGALYNWVGANHQLIPLDSRPSVGDMLFYGTGPQSSSSSPHMGIVEYSWPDGEVVTVEGDSGPGGDGYYGTNLNGPFSIVDSINYNGEPVYGLGAP